MSSILVNSRRGFSCALLQIVAALCFLAAATCGWLWYRNKVARQVTIPFARGSVTIDVGKLADARLLDVSSGRQITIAADGKGPKHLIIFLTAADCSSCLAQLADWMPLISSTRQRDFEVDLLYIYTSRAEFEEFHKSHNFPYHVWLDAFSDAGHLLPEPSTTPVSILVGNNLHVLAAQGPEQSVDRRQEFVALVASQLTR